MSEVYATLNIIPWWYISGIILGFGWVIFISVYFTFYSK